MCLLLFKDYLPQRVIAALMAMLSMVCANINRVSLNFAVTAMTPNVHTNTSATDIGETCPEPEVTSDETQDEVVSSKT